MWFVNVDLSLVSNSDCQHVKSQIMSLPIKQGDASVVLECETKMNMEGSSVNVVPEAKLSGTVPHCKVRLSKQYQNG